MRGEFKSKAHREGRKEHSPTWTRQFFPKSFLLLLVAMVIFYKSFCFVELCLYIALKLNFQNVAAKTRQNFCSPVKNPSNLIWTQYSLCHNWSSASINWLVLLEFQATSLVWNGANMAHSEVAFQPAMGIIPHRAPLPLFFDAIYYFFFIFNNANTCFFHWIS